MASRGGAAVGGRVSDRSPQVTTRDLRIFLMVAIILSVLLSARTTTLQHYKLSVNLPLPGMTSSAKAAARLGGRGQGGARGDGDVGGAANAETDGWGTGGGGEHAGEHAGSGDGGSSDIESAARQRREERRARRQERRAEIAAANDAAAAVAGGDARKLQPGEGNAVTHTRIFETGSMLRGGRSTLEYAHMGMLEEIPGGHLMAAWQAAPDLEGGAGQSVYFAYSKDAVGREWGAPHKLPHGPADRSVGASPGQWAPVLFQRGDTTWIFYSENSPKCLRPSVVDAPHPLPKRWIIGGTIYARTLRNAGPAPGGARDDGVGDATGWSKPMVIYSQRQENTIPKLIANKLTTLGTGEWILPFWRQRSTHVCASQRTHFNSAGVMRSTDQGLTWEAHGDLTLPGGKNKWVIEGTVVELTISGGTGSEGGGGKGKVLAMLLRSTEGHVYRSDSSDAGVTWGDPARTALVNPDSKIAALGLQDGRILIAFNDQQARTQGIEDVDKGLAIATKRRDTLVVAVSSSTSSSSSAADGGGDGGGGGGDADSSDAAAMKLHVFARLDEGKPGLMVHYPTLTVRKSDPSKVLVTYTRSYNNRSTATLPREDGIWLAEIDIPRVGEEDGRRGGIMGEEEGYPVRSMAVVGPGENAHNPDNTAVGGGGAGIGAHGGSGSGGGHGGLGASSSFNRLHAAMAEAQDTLKSSSVGMGAGVAAGAAAGEHRQQEQLWQLQQLLKQQQQQQQQLQLRDDASGLGGGAMTSSSSSSSSALVEGQHEEHPQQQHLDPLPTLGAEDEDEDLGMM